MSDSRLEKFIYAICSMEVSDLPVPLSRIEKLWNCLITGETPDFEPLSRNEKYLMAMLNRYDVSNLPAPMSRGEKLLYKIAVGETDLSDVPGYLSRYEELLKYLIENGGIGFEYVLYTLNQSLSTLYATVEKPVKSAILKGKTVNNLWANLAHNVSVQQQTDDTIIEDYSEQYTRVTFGESQVNSATTIGIRTTQKLQANKTYYINTFVFDALDVTDSFLIRDNSNNINLNTPKIEGYPPGQILSFTTQAETNHLIFYYFAHTRKYGAVNYGKPFYMPKRFIISDKLEDVVNQEFFEGMQSVKLPVLTTTGKNLFDKSTVKYNTTIQSYDDGQEVADNNYMVSDFIEVKPNTTYTSNYMGVILYYDENRKFIGALDDTVLPQNFTTPNNCKYIRIRCWERYNTIEKQREIVELEQLEEGSVATSYEPYKSNILSCLEPVELGSVGEVKDELNLLTQQLTQRTETRPYQEGDELNSEFVTDMTNTRYKLAQEVIKTVVLTTVDQDGQPIKLKTFNDITYVEINADNIIPSVNVEVATKMNETLSTMGLQHHDISNTQNQLSQTIEEQSENTDATMMATTEIYEQTL